MKIHNSALMISILLISVHTYYGMEKDFYFTKALKSLTSSTASRKKISPTTTPHTSPTKKQDARVKSPRFMTRVRKQLIFETNEANDDNLFNIPSIPTPIYEQPYTEGKASYSLFEDSSSEEEGAKPTHHFSDSFDYLISQMDNSHEMQQYFKSQEEKAQEVKKAIKSGRQYAKEIKRRQLAKLNCVPSTNKSHSNSPEKISGSYSHSSNSQDDSDNSFFK